MYVKGFSFAVLVLTSHTVDAVYSSKVEDSLLRELAVLPQIHMILPERYLLVFWPTCVWLPSHAGYIFLQVLHSGVVEENHFSSHHRQTSTCLLSNCGASFVVIGFCLCATFICRTFLKLKITVYWKVLYNSVKILGQLWLVWGRAHHMGFIFDHSS